MRATVPGPGVLRNWEGSQLGTLLARNDPYKGWAGVVGLKCNKSSHKAHWDCASSY